MFESVFEACGLGERSEFSFSRVRNLAMEDGPSRDLTLPSKRNDKPPEGDFAAWLPAWTRRESKRKQIAFVAGRLALFVGAIWTAFVYCKASDTRMEVTYRVCKGAD